MFDWSVHPWQRQPKVLREECADYAANSPMIGALDRAKQVCIRRGQKLNFHSVTRN